MNDLDFTIESGHEDLRHPIAGISIGTSQCTMIGTAAVGVSSRRYFLEKTIPVEVVETNPILDLFNYDKSPDYHSAEAYSKLIENCVPIMLELITGSELQKAGLDCPVVLSVPSYLDERQRMALKLAAQKAGFNVLRVIDDDAAVANVLAPDKPHKMEKNIFQSLTPAAITAVGAAIKAVELGSCIRWGVYLRKEPPPS
ncbi:MAG: Hsp70 family protein [Cyanobacteria bacterium SZAS-4]|nr:Hsp70 family protein [Cyanobacteria bacterium SZAS-4]